jgi:hypothetical protein
VRRPGQREVVAERRQDGPVGCDRRAGMGGELRLEGGRALEEGLDFARRPGDFGRYFLEATFS